jgi:hypothetical protein
VAVEIATRKFDHYSLCLGGLAEWKAASRTADRHKSCGGSIPSPCQGGMLSWEELRTLAPIPLR